MLILAMFAGIASSEQVLWNKDDPDGMPAPVSQRRLHET